MNDEDEKTATNPRWIACRAALGRVFEGWEFVLWLGPRWQEFAELHGYKREPHDMHGPSGFIWGKFGLAEGQARFDDWLLAGVREGKWTTVPGETGEGKAAP